MGEFFKGWRRKAGLVTLVMALVLSVAWMRSLIIEDIVSIEYRHFDTIVTSSRGFVISHRTLDPKNNQSGPTPTVLFDSTELSVDDEGRDSPVDLSDPWLSYGDDEIDWRRDLGVSFGAGIRHGPRGAIHHFKMWAIPYWLLALTLTLLSAWLILGKRPKAKPAIPKPDD